MWSNFSLNSFSKLNRGVSEFSKRTNVWRYNVGSSHGSKDKETFKHPATFPEKLARDHIISWSNKNDIVYDPFIGSGTTATIAIREDRRFIGSEINKEYYKIAKKRIKKEIEQEKLRIFKWKRKDWKLETV